MDIVTYALLKKKIGSAVSGIQSITYNETTRKFDFLMNDGSHIYVSIPPSNQAIEVVSSLPTPSASEEGKYYMLDTDNNIYKCEQNSSTGIYEFVEISNSSHNGVLIVEDYSKLSPQKEEIIAYVKNNYVDTAVTPNVRYLSGFYLYDYKNSTWNLISTIADNNCYEYDVTTPKSIWNIQHNLNGKYYQLQITITDGNGNIIYGDIDATNSTNNLLVLKFDEPISGKIYIKK